MVEILEKILVLTGVVTWIFANIYSVIKQRYEIKMMKLKEKRYQKIFDGHFTQS